MSDSLVNVTVEPKELVITLSDSSSTTVELNPNPVEVTINSAVQNTVTITLGGGRGAVWLPNGGTYDGTALAAILAGHISKTQLANDLAEEIELTSTGLIEAQADLQGAINTLLATGDTLDDTVSRMEIVEDNIILQSYRLDSVESNITTARVDIDDNIIRLTAAETSLTDNSNYIITQQSILSNEWTVKIFENTDGTKCSAGIGLLVYPAWKVNSVYEIDDYCWFDDSVYKSKIVHTSSESITPANSSYWELIPYGTKSQFGVLADTFFVQTQKDGDIYTPFVIYEDQVVINGDMLVNGLISANLISASGIATWTLQSHNYESGISGYKLDAATGLAEFNDITLEVNYNPLDTSFKQWNLNGQTIVTVTDGVVGNKALRLGVPQGLYPNSNMYTAIDYTKVYTVSFWAKPSSDADGILYFSLRQYLNDTGTPGPINSGRSPYKPSGYSRAYHNTLFGAGNWGFYSFTWSSADWQTGVKYVMPEFLNNYASTTGCWYIQGFTFEDVTAISTIDCASLINNNTTTIHGGKITTGSIGASQITAHSLTGDRIASHTISADNIVSKSLTANEIATGAIYAGSGIIDNLAVDTLHIAGRAITVPSSAYTAASINVSSGYTIVQSIYVSPMGGQPLIIIASAIAEQSWGGSYYAADVNIILEYNSTNIVSNVSGIAGATFDNTPTKGVIHLAISYIPPAGGAYIYFKLQGANITVSNRSLVVIEAKR